ncbi:MAG: HDOD domain-containing protein [Tepidimonas sp.]|uniref:HDOD domain-containing protein n=1 Tax=Tepidimonas sp. TaxID=2002775 RepID=UPI00298F04E2|nr:HDOD domain-containing protein [Tepidimonas sp.]MDW8336869.1 HDOD domain-containing protein [Tepidimonas sp.]
MRLEELLQRPEALPVVPEVAAQLISTFGQDEVDLNRVAQQLERDPALAARVLQQANSAFFRLLRPVHSVRDAVWVLGLTRLRALVLAAAVQSRFAAPPGIELERFWAYSFVAASLARTVCVPRRLDDAVAFTAALLHAVGELVMHQVLPQQMVPLDGQTPWWSLQRPEAEQRMLGYTYAEVGAALAAHWRLPRTLVQAIEAHIHPLRAEPPDPLAAVVHMVAWRARVWCLGNDRDTLIHSYPDAVGELLQLDPDLLVDPGIVDVGAAP